MSKHYTLSAWTSLFLSAAMAIVYFAGRRQGIGRKSWPIYFSGYFAYISLISFSSWLETFQTHVWALYLADLAIQLPNFALCIFVFLKPRYRPFPVFRIYCIAACLASLVFIDWHNYGSGPVVFYLSWLITGAGELLEMYMVFTIFAAACQHYPEVIRVTRWAGIVSALVYTGLLVSSLVKNHGALTVLYLALPSLSYNLLLLIPSGLLLIVLLFKQVLALPVERNHLLIGIGLGLQSVSLLTVFALFHLFKRADLDVIVSLTGLRGVSFVLFCFAMLPYVECGGDIITPDAAISHLNDLVSFNKILASTIHKR